MKSNLPQHPCAGKCTAFNGEQCATCLITIEPADFAYGDMVVKTHGDDDTIYEFSRFNVVNSKFGWIHKPRKAFMQCFEVNSLKHATTAELKANCRLPVPLSDINEHLARVAVAQGEMS